MGEGLGRSQKRHIRGSEDKMFLLPPRIESALHPRMYRTLCYRRRRIVSICVTICVMCVLLSSVTCSLRKYNSVRAQITNRSLHNLFETFILLHYIVSNGGLTSW